MTLQLVINCAFWRVPYIRFEFCNIICTQILHCSLHTPWLWCFQKIIPSSERKSGALQTRSCQDGLVSAFTLCWTQILFYKLWHLQHVCIRLLECKHRAEFFCYRAIWARCWKNQILNFQLCLMSKSSYSVEKSNKLPSTRHRALLKNPAVLMCKHILSWYIVHVMCEAGGRHSVQCYSLQQMYLFNLIIFHSCSGTWKAKWMAREQCELFNKMIAVRSTVIELIKTEILHEHVYFSYFSYFSYFTQAHVEISKMNILEFIIEAFVWSIFGCYSTSACIRFYPDLFIPK